MSSMEALSHAVAGPSATANVHCVSSTPVAPTAAPADAGARGDAAGSPSSSTRSPNGATMSPIPMLPLHASVGTEKEYYRALDVMQKKPIYSVEMQKNRLQCRDGKSTQLFGGNATRGQILAVALGITHADLQRERLLELAQRPSIGVYQVAEVLPSCCIVTRSLQRSTRMAAQTMLPEPDEELAVNPHEPSRHICLRQICPGVAGATLGFVLRRRIEGRLPSDKKHPFWAPGFRGRRRSQDTRRTEESEEDEPVGDDDEADLLGEEESMLLKPDPVATRLRRPRRASSEAAASALAGAASSSEKSSRSNGLKGSLTHRSRHDDSTDSGAVAAAAAAAAERALPIRKRRSGLSPPMNGHHDPPSPIPTSASGEVELIIASMATKKHRHHGMNGGYMNGAAACSGSCDEALAKQHLLRELEAKVVVLNEQLTKETREHINDMRRHMEAVRSTQASLNDSLAQRAFLQRQVGELEASCSQHKAQAQRLLEQCDRMRKELSKHGVQLPQVEEQQISPMSA